MTPKLPRNWKGPYVVIKQINDVYRIQLGPRTKPRVVHRNRLWKYSGLSPPTWLKTMAEQGTRTETDRSIESETSCSTTVQARRKLETVMEADLTSSAITMQQG